MLRSGLCPSALRHPCLKSSTVWNLRSMAFCCDELCGSSNLGADGVGYCKYRDSIPLRSVRVRQALPPSSAHLPQCCSQLWRKEVCFPYFIAVLWERDVYKSPFFSLAGLVVFSCIISLTFSVCLVAYSAYAKGCSLRICDGIAVTF